MMLIMEETVHGWQAVGSWKGYSDGGEDGAGRRKASEQKEGDNDVPMMKKKIMAETVIKSQ